MKTVFGGYKGKVYYAESHSARHHAAIDAMREAKAGMLGDIEKSQTEPELRTSRCPGLVTGPQPAGRLQIPRAEVAKC